MSDLSFSRQRRALNDLDQATVRLRTLQRSLPKGANGIAAQVKAALACLRLARHQLLEAMKES